MYRNIDDNNIINEYTNIIITYRLLTFLKQ